MSSIIFFCLGGALALSSCIAYDQYKDNKRLRDYNKFLDENYDNGELKDKNESLSSESK